MRNKQTMASTKKKPQELKYRQPMFSEAAREIDDIVARFQKSNGGDREEAMSMLMLSLGHHADLHGIDFLEAVNWGLGHWHASAIRRAA
jgi:hypothetical protein